MKKLKTYWFLAILAASCAGVPQADGQGVFSVATSGAVITQGKLNNDTDDYAPLSRGAWSTRSLLKQLAIDEHAAGVWTNLTSSGKIAEFPARSKLVLSSNEFFVALSPSSLLSVSNIISLGVSGANAVSQTHGDTQTIIQLATFTYNSSPIGGTEQYSISGVAYTDQTGGELTALIFQSGAGQGINGSGVPIAFSGVRITAKKLKSQTAF